MAEHMPIRHPLLVALEESGLGQAMREQMLLYPVVEVLHILGFIALFSGIVLFDLRVLGFGRGLGPLLRPEALSRIALPVAAGGLGLAILMGILLFATEATHLAANPAFRLKLILILLGFANLAAFHFMPWGRMATWPATPPLPAKLAAGFSLLIWISVAICGRLIAYL